MEGLVLVQRSIRWQAPCLCPYGVIFFVDGVVLVLELSQLAFPWTVTQIAHEMMENFTFE